VTVLAGLSCTSRAAAAQVCDPALMAHAERARDYVTSGTDARLAHEEWRRALDPERRIKLPKQSRGAGW
jgi:hypothetical protein